MITDYVVSRVAVASELFESEPTLVYWLTLTPAVVDTIGLCSIRDGTDVTGKVKWQAETGENMHYVFSPAIRCYNGLFIEVDAHIDIYTVGYLPEEVAKRLSK